jgi:hypothetical protein
VQATFGSGTLNTEHVGAGSEQHPELLRRRSPVRNVRSVGAEVATRMNGIVILTSPLPFLKNRVVVDDGEMLKRRCLL